MRKIAVPVEHENAFRIGAQRLLLVPSAFTSSAETKVQVPTICFLSVFPLLCESSAATRPALRQPASSAPIYAAQSWLSSEGCSSIRFGATPPVRPTVWVPPLSVIVTLPEAVPAAVGAM